ncbi:hypothetical protein [Streptomyces sp. NEAU-YJ-81]|uniref:hypothetical protein n=1 Tax=Streptomyces sp. NEAU-YJ-81 TaxID=2820288 RepID=UPI001ABCF6B6|nr:hypothetical protein [Streptomyces sp. NEAU-YJ-81]MBO3676090.1 hypothetical protein [Streptomyces sp. NEAU-YJ-81]
MSWPGAGRKRGIAIDIMGLIIAVVVTAVSGYDNQVGTALLTKIAARTATVEKALVDQGFKTTVVEHGAGLGIDVYESNPASSESRVYWVITAVMARRLTGAAAPTWRGA